MTPRLSPHALAVLSLFACTVATMPAAASRKYPDVAALAEADKLIEEAIAEEKLPGAVLLAGKDEKVLYRKAYGARAVKPQRVAMTEDTIFDAASLSKPVGCATSVMILVERGKVRLEDPVAKYLPPFGANGKDRITIEQLLVHRGGLIADNPMTDYEGGREASLSNVFNLKAHREPGTKFVYTDVGYIVLGELVKAVDGRPLDQFAKEEIFEPLGMKDTTYKPAESLRPRIAPTERRNDQWMRGEVHDPRAYALGGVAGHAGLFTTADDLSRYCRMILNGGQLDGRRILSEGTVKEMTRPRALPDATGVRTLAFDVDTPYSSPRGDRFPRGESFGHTGFTGTMFWMDPQSRSYVILMSNSVHPDGKGRVIELRGAVSTVVAEALLGPAQAPAVLTGIDVLKRDNFKQLQGHKVALVTNHTGRDRDGNRTIDVLAKAPGVKVVHLFSPEHGLGGVLDEKVGHTTDEKTGLKVFSLYGETRRPTAEMLKGVDTLVFDIQDIGARFYTYISTMGICMEEAAKHKLKMVVLDRPNPNTGLVVEGPIAQKKHFGFIAYGPIPVSHGMTVGELAQFFNAEMGIGCDLQVIPVDGWKRHMWWDETGLAWVNPSPNIRNPTQAMLYPGIGLLETTNLSVGRGTDQPFELLGAPWMDGRKLAPVLNGARIRGLRFTPVSFTPNTREFKGQPCHGVYIQVTDRKAFSPVTAGVQIAWHIEKLFPDAYKLEGIGRMLHNDDAVNALMKAEDPTKVSQAWEKELEAFKQVRAKYLIYR